MAAGSHRNFLPDFIPPNPPNQPPSIQFPGFRIPLSNAPPSRVDRYPADRALIDNFFNDIGTEESAFVALAITGLLVPFTPALLGFRVFGRGLGGLFRTAAVSSVTTAYAASYNYELASLRWRTKDPEIKGPDRKVLSFLVSERNRIRKAVLVKADLWQPNRPRKTIPNAHPIVKSWLYRTQWELWRWQACLSILFWTPRIESAWQQVFADAKFVDQTRVNWTQFFEIPRSMPEKYPSLATLYLTPDWWSGEGLPGVLVRDALWKNSPPEVRELARARHQEKYRDGNCGDLYRSVFEARWRMKLYERRSREYLDGEGERNILLEDATVRLVETTTNELKKLISAVIDCEEMNKAMTGKFDVETVKEGSALSNVLRLAKSNQREDFERIHENGDYERILQQALAIKGKGGVSVNKGADIIPLAGKEASPTPPPKETTKETTPAAQVHKSEKKSVGVQVKKNETDEKGKDESSTGVENS